MNDISKIVAVSSKFAEVTSKFSEDNPPSDVYKKVFEFYYTFLDKCTSSTVDKIYSNIELLDTVL